MFANIISFTFINKYIYTLIVNIHFNYVFSLVKLLFPILLSLSIMKRGKDRNKTSGREYLFEKILLFQNILLSLYQRIEILK